MQIKARAPLRLGIAGGGTDVSPYLDLFGGCVLSGAISRYAYAVLTPLDVPEIRFNATDLKKRVILNTDDDVELDGDLILHKSVYKNIIELFNNGRPIAHELTTFCEAPIGSGLGSSSTVVVAMIKAYVELLNLPLDDYAIANLAFKIERVDCGLQGGKQDQFSATFGGFNFMEFYANDRTVINPLRIKNWIVCELESSLILYYTGVSRESAGIIADQTRNLKVGKNATLGALHGIKSEAIFMKESLLRGDFSSVVQSIQDGWINKKNTAKGVSNPQIDEIYDEAISAGAVAGKVSGAGGGGFLWFFVPLSARMDVIRALSKFGGTISNCIFTSNGAQAWRVS